PHGTYNPAAPYGSSFMQHNRYPATMQQLQQPFAYRSLQQPQQPLQQEYRSQEWVHPQFSPASSSSLWSPGSSGTHHHTNRSGSSLTVPSFHHTVPRRVKVSECEKELNGALQKMLRGEGLEGGGRGRIRGDWEWRRSAFPLIQITTLINCKESLMGAKGRSEKAIRAALKVGSAVESAIERFVAVGETIADENPDVQPEMYDACHEARLAGASMSNLSCMPNEGMSGPESAIDKQVIVRASRQLLSSVTRVLLLADRVLVKQIIRAEDKVAYSLSRLETTRSFTDFVKIFAEFGGEMVDLAHRSGDRQHDMKSEKRRAQMGVARTSLERTTMLLLTSSKCLLRHPESESARQCRDGVFYQMRVALQLIATCISDGVLPIETDRYCPSNPDEPLDIGIQLTANAAIRQLTEMLDMVRMTSRVGTGVRERLVSAIDALCELTQDFTDSAYTTHHHREQVLDFLEECRFEMTNLIQPEVSSRDDTMDVMRNEGLEVTVERLNRRLRDLSKQLQIVAMEQLSEVFGANEDQVLMSSIKACAVSGDIDGVEKYLDKFREHAEHMQEVCRLLHHISITDGLHVSTGHCERNMRAFAPLCLLAGRTLCMHPSSRIARENLEVFCDTWSQILNDLSRLTKESDAASNGRLAAERQAYMSLPRPGVRPSPSSPLTSSSHSPIHSSSLSPPIQSTVHSIARIRPPALISSASNLLSLSRGNLSLSSGLYPSTDRLIPPPKPPRVMRKRSRESQEVTHTFYDGSGEESEREEESGRDERGEVVLRHGKGEREEREEEKRQFEYRMSLILDRLEE
ncbi:ctn-1, partial [Pristionchus pacificus]